MADKIVGQKGHFTKTDIEQKVKIAMASKDKIIEEKNEIINSLKSEMSKISEELKKYKVGEIIIGTEEQKIKKVLEFRARGHDVFLIKEKIEFVGMHIDIDEIETICKNIDSLSIEYQAYYKQCVEDYETTIKLNPQILKMKNLEHNLFSIDEAKKMIADSLDSGERKKNLELLNTLILTNTKILSDTVLNNKDEVSENNSMNDMIKDYEEQKSNNIIKFDLSKIKKI